MIKLRCTDLDRAALLEIVADLAAPIDPMVFAGFGSPLQNAIAEGTDRDGVFETHRHVEQMKIDWAASVDPVEILPGLIDILRAPPGPELQNDLRRRRLDDWNHELLTLIAHVGRRAPALFRTLIGPLLTFADTRAIAAEAIDYFEDDDPCAA